MKIVKTGDVSRIFSDDLQTFDKLPVGNYKVGFAPMAGFYLEDADDFKTNEKSYGKHPLKIAKVTKLYDSTERSVGVILSGKKGMGKSMFAREVSVEFAKSFNMPTIIVTEAYPGIVEFIESIKQECAILFDEFEKVFTNSGNESNSAFAQKQQEGVDKESQVKLLSLFDGVSQTKRMYMITVNDVKKVNDYMINRPGRFHYHLQFNYPSLEEIEMYLKDKLKPEFHNQIALVQRFANRFDLNYDSLRAIAFDLNLGYGFLETMEDLNISSSEGESIRYDIAIHHSNGLVVKTDASVNLMNSSFRFSYNSARYDNVCVEFSPLEVEIQNKDSFVVKVGEVAVDVAYDIDNEILTEASGIRVDKLIFTKKTYAPQFGKEVRGLLT